MVKYLTPHGNSSALVIDKPILELLGIDQKTALEMSTDGQNLIVSPIKNPKREASFRSALEKVDKRHSKTLRKLAE